MERAWGVRLEVGHQTLDRALEHAELAPQLSGADKPVRQDARHCIVDHLRIALSRLTRGPTEHGEQSRLARRVRARIALGGSPDAIANIDVTLRLQQLAEGLEPSRIAGWVEAIVLLREQLKQNVSRQLALEAIFLSQERLVVAPL